MVLYLSLTLSCCRQPSYASSWRALTIAQPCGVSRREIVLTLWMPTIVACGMCHSLNLSSTCIRNAAKYSAGIRQSVSPFTWLYLYHIFFIDIIILINTCSCGSHYLQMYAHQLVRIPYFSTPYKAHWALERTHAYKGLKPHFAPKQGSFTWISPFLTTIIWFLWSQLIFIHENPTTAQHPTQACDISRVMVKLCLPATNLQCSLAHTSTLWACWLLDSSAYGIFTTWPWLLAFRDVRSLIFSFIYI